MCACVLFVSFFIMCYLFFIFGNMRYCSCYYCFGAAASLCTITVIVVTGGRFKNVLAILLVSW